MNDPRNLGLGELGQRVQAMSDPLPDSRLRPYQGGPAPVPASNGHSGPTLEAYEHVQATPAPPIPPAPAAPSPTPYSQQPYSVPYSPQVPPQIPLQVPPQAPGPSPAPSPYAASGASSAVREPISRWETVPQPPSAQPQPPAVPATPPPAAAAAPVDPNAPKSGIQRAIDAIRSTIPLVQKLLPLIDGNIATAVGALVTHVQPAPPPQVRVDLEPVERGLAEVRNSNRELRNQIAEQAASFKRVEDQLDRVREATDRNTLEQQELVEDLRSVGSRVSLFAIVGLVLLAASLGLNIYLIFQLQHILR